MRSLRSAPTAETSGAVARLSTREVGQLGDLIPSFERSLRARNRSPRTIRSYVESARLLVGFLAEQGMPTTVDGVRREHVEAFIEDQLARWTPSTAASRYRYVQQFFRWLEEEGEIASSPMARMKPPAVSEEPVAVLSDDEIRRLLTACDGRGYEERRDAAIVRLFLDTGVRLAELTGLRTDDVDFATGVVLVVGKGRRPRACPFGPKTAQALDRYLRVRAGHPLHDQRWLWLGARAASPIRAWRRCFVVVRQRPGSRPCILTSSATRSPTRGSPRAATRAIECASPAGAAARCSTATAQRLPTSGHGRRTAD